MFESLEKFMSTSVVKKLELDYGNLQRLARASLEQLNDVLNEMGCEYEKTHKKRLLTSVEFRVKKKPSFFNRLYQRSKLLSKKQGVSDDLVNSEYKEIKDVAGGRFAVAYVSDVADAVVYMKTYLADRGYGTALDDYKDKNLIDAGDEYGYRSYHFYIKIPTVTDIYGATEHMLCEIQGRSELQHVWAVKSHDLIYKNGNKNIELEDIKEDMKHISHSLRSADHALDRIREKVASSKKRDEK